MTNDLYRRQFQRNWEHFITILQSDLKQSSQDQKVNYNMAKIALSIHSEYWDTKEKDGGRWIYELEKENPEEANLIRNILLKDMRFSEEVSSDSLNASLKFIVPIGSAVTGFALSKAFGANNVVRIISTIVPAAVAYPITNNMIDVHGENQKEETIQSYLSQLDKYKLSIESVLSGI